MMSRTIRFTAACLLLAFACVSLAASTEELLRGFGKATLDIATPDARIHHFNVWVADDGESRQRGLMFVRELGDDQGMIFLYPEAQPIQMWMKNTFIPLDMLFIDANGRVVNVARNTTPQSLAIIDSKRDASAVLEVKAGTAKRLNIAEGARVTWKAKSSSRAP